MKRLLYTEKGETILQTFDSLTFLNKTKLGLADFRKLPCTSGLGNSHIKVRVSHES